MAYRLRPDRPLPAELVRVATRQLKRASAELTAAGPRLRPENVHAARKRVKKVRALLQFARPSFPKRTFRAIKTHLRKVSRSLGSISDVGATLAALDRLARRHANEIPAQTASDLRRVLQQRDIAIRRRARRRRISARCEHVLLSEARHAGHWRLHGHTVGRLLSGLGSTERRARKAMKAAWRHPDAGRLHAWRRRVKDEWLQLRLFDEHSSAELEALRDDLEALDGVLGAYHDLALLRRALEDEDAVSRGQTAAVLRVIARDRRALRRRARRIGRRVYGEVAA